MIWSQDLIDTQEFSGCGVDLYLRLAASELKESTNNKRTAIIASVTITGAILAVVLLLLFLRRGKMQRGKRENVERTTNKYNFEVGQLELQEPPLYTYDMLRNATNNFDESNKLGEGGFGPIYKGILETGQEIGVKRSQHLLGKDWRTS